MLNLKTKIMFVDATTEEERERKPEQNANNAAKRCCSQKSNQATKQPIKHLKRKYPKCKPTTIHNNKKIKIKNPTKKTTTSP